VGAAVDDEDVSGDEAVADEQGDGGGDVVRVPCASGWSR